MKLSISLLLLCLISLDTSRSVADEPAKADPIVGRWQVIGLEARGKMDSGISYRGMRFEFDGQTWTTWPGKTTPAGIAGKPPTKRKYTIDDSHAPKHLDWVVNTENGSRVIQAIFKIEEGKLHICMGKEQRPSAFSTKGTKDLHYVADRKIAEFGESDKRP